MACEQVNELKKQLEQTNQQGDGMTLEDVTSDQGDVTFRLGSVSYTHLTLPTNREV